MTIRRARTDDDAFFRQLSKIVFDVFGPYDAWIPQWASYPGVLSYVAELDRRRAGFYMLGFYREQGITTADLLAIAVDPGSQRRGVGRALLAHAVNVAMRSSALALTLSVADDNLSAQQLFLRSGFVFLPGQHGTYEGGQRTLKMRLQPLAKATAPAILD